MNLLCRFFGHVQQTLYADREHHFFMIDPPYWDGIGRSHRTLWFTCERCKGYVRVGKCIDSVTSEKRL
jgi:hypothetical protein